jgi:NAD-dependent deacetylase
MSRLYNREQTALFILGAGASVDSGLPTYRGTNSIYGDDCASYENILTRINKPDSIWRILDPLYEKIITTKPGETYRLLEKLIYSKYPNSMIVTQNIDGLCNNISVPTIEIHGSYKYIDCMECGKKTNYSPGHKCGECNSDQTMPDIILFDDSISRDKYNEIISFIKQNIPKHIFIIGTTLQFGYLTDIVNTAKQRLGKCIHINPDDIRITKDEHMKMTSAEALQILLDN